MGVEEFDQLGEVGERAGQSVDLVDDFLLCWCPVVRRHPPVCGPELACRPRPTSRWYLEQMVAIIAGEQFWLWCTIDEEGEVLDQRPDMARNATSFTRPVMAIREAPSRFDAAPGKGSPLLE
jgi:hypothetical protein